MSEFIPAPALNPEPVVAAPPPPPAPQEPPVQLTPFAPPLPPELPFPLIPPHAPVGEEVLEFREAFPPLAVSEPNTEFKPFDPAVSEQSPVRGAPAPTFTVKGVFAVTETEDPVKTSPPPPPCPQYTPQNPRVPDPPPATTKYLIDKLLLGVQVIEPVFLNWIMQSLPLFVTDISLESLTVCVQLPAESPGAVTGTAIAGVGEIKPKLVDKTIDATRNRKPFETLLFPVADFTAEF
jgi:hypothetical protein